MRTLLRIPFITEEGYIYYMESHPLFCLETGCSVGSNQIRTYITKNYSLTFKVESLDEFPEENGKRIVTASTEGMFLTNKRNRTTDMKFSPWLKNSATRQFLNDLFLEKEKWVPSDQRLERFRI